MTTSEQLKVFSAFGIYFFVRLFSDRFEGPCDGPDTGQPSTVLRSYVSNTSFRSIPFAAIAVRSVNTSGTYITSTCVQPDATRLGPLDNMY